MIRGCDGIDIKNDVERPPDRDGERNRISLTQVESGPERPLLIEPVSNLSGRVTQVEQIKRRAELSGNTIDRVRQCSRQRLSECGASNAATADQVADNA